MLNFKKINFDINIDNLILALGLNIKGKNSLSCPFHKDNSPSAYIGYKANIFGCKSCGRKLNNINFIMQLKGLTEYEAGLYIIELLGLNLSDFIIKDDKYIKNEFKTPNKIKNLIKNDKKEANKIIKKVYIKSKEIEIKENINKFNKRYSFILDKNGTINEKKKEIVINYLKKRGIKNIDVLLNIFKYNNIDFGTDFNNQVNFFFHNQKLCIYRTNKNEFNIKNDIPINKNLICGVLNIIPIRANKTNIFYIVEGIYDAFSFLNEKQNVICLNSAGNTNKFFTYFYNNLEQIKKYKIEFILAMDNDKQGEKAEKDIIEFFHKNKYFNYDIFDMHRKLGFKDINDLLQSKGEIFAKEKSRF